MAGGPCPSLVVCVLGLSRDKGVDFSRGSGVGKSCFCYRFMHPGYDDYMDDHSSLLALHEFENPVINNVHFLYWGSTTRSYPVNGGPKEQRIQFHVIEQTVFYQDVTSQPFTIITKPDSLEHYIRRATSQIESPGKISYKTRDTISLQQDYRWQSYPSGLSGWPRGFIVVIDVSQSYVIFDSQIARAERVMDYLIKHKRKFVIVATKRDIMNPVSMEKVQELSRKYKSHVFESSANANLNIADAFRFIASKVLHKKVQGISDRVTTYEEAAHVLLTQKGRARKSFLKFLLLRIEDSDERIDTIENMEQYKECVRALGKFETDRLFAEHLMEVHNKKVETYAGVPDNPELRLEFLEDFIDQRTDLGLYTDSLKRWIKSYFDEHPMESPESSPEMDRKEEAGVSKEADLGYQVFQKPGSPGSHSHRTLDSGVQQDTATLNSNTSAYDGDGSNSYYSDSFDSEYDDIVDYINYPLLPANKLSTAITSDGGESKGPEAQELDSELQDMTPMNEQITLESTVPSAGVPPALVTSEEVKHAAGHTLLPEEVGVAIREEAKDTNKEEEEEEEEGGNVRDLAAKLSAHFNGGAVPKSKIPPPIHKKPNLGSKSSSLKQDNEDIGEEEAPVTPPVSGNIKSRAERLRKLLSGEDEDLEPPVAEAPLKKSSPPMTRRDSKQEGSLKSSLPGGTRKPVRPAPKPPASPKYPKNKESHVERYMLQHPQPSQAPPGQPLPSPLQHSPVTSPSPPHQALVPSPVTPVSGNIPNQEIYVPKLPTIKKKIAEKHLHEQKKEIEDLPPPIPPHPKPIETPPPSHPPPLPPHPKHTESPPPSPPPPLPPPPKQIVSPPPPPSPSLTPRQVLSPDHSLPPPPPRRIESIGQGEPNLTVPHDPGRHSQDEDIQPPIPQRTSEMFLAQAPLQSDDGSSVTKQKLEIREVEDDKEGKGKKRRFYQDVVLPGLKKLLKSDGKEKEGKETASSTKKPKSEEKRPRSATTAVDGNIKMVEPPRFVHMKDRPLPVEPFSGEVIDDIDHEATDYEPVDFEGRDLLLAEYGNLPGSTAHPPASQAPQLPGQTSAVRRAQSFESRLRFQVGGNDIRSRRCPSPPSLARAQVPPWGSSHAHNDDTVDAEGYVQTDISPSHHRPHISKWPLPPPPDEHEQSPLRDYDYPNLRAFCTLPSRRNPLTSPLKLPGRTLPPRNVNRSAGEVNTFSDYVPMNSTVDDNYYNWETIGSIRMQLLGESPRSKQPPPVPAKSKSRRYSLDDLAVYMNLPIPVKPIALPPRQQEIEHQPAIGTVQESSPRPTPSPRMPRSTGETSSPVIAKKPTPRPRPRPRAQPAAAGLELDSQTSPSFAPEMSSLGPNPVPAYRGPPSPRPRQTGFTSVTNPPDICSSSLPHSFGDSFGGDVEFSHPSPPEVHLRKLSGHHVSAVPPRNILRPTKEH